VDIAKKKNICLYKDRVDSVTSLSFDNYIMVRKKDADSVRVRNNNLPPGGKVVLSGHANPAVVKNRRKFNSGTNVLREIRRLVTTTDLIIPKAPFKRIIRWIAREIKSDVMIEENAIQALQESLEGHMVSKFENINTCAIHAKRITIMPADMTLERRILEKYNSEPWEEEFKKKK
jgi:histone H3